jgi:hypothetical protein
MIFVACRWGGGAGMRAMPYGRGRHTDLFDLFDPVPSPRDTRDVRCMHPMPVSHWGMVHSKTQRPLQPCTSPVQGTSPPRPAP